MPTENPRISPSVNADRAFYKTLNGSVVGAVLEAKRAGAPRRANMRDFLLREQQLRATTPARITQLVRVAYTITGRAMGHQLAIGAA